MATKEKEKTYSVQEAGIILGLSAKWAGQHIEERPITRESIETILDQRQAEVDELISRLQAMVAEKDGDNPKFNGREIAKIFGVTRQAVYQWREIPVNAAAVGSKIERQQAEINKSRRLLEMLS